MTVVRNRHHLESSLMHSHSSSGVGLDASEFGSLTFTGDVMLKRLPADVFDKLQQTMKRGLPLDPAIANTVALAMKDWAIEHGCTHYCHWFQPLTGSTAEKHDAFLCPDGDGRRDREVLRRGADPRRAGRFIVPLRRHPRHLRGPRLHRVGRHQPRVHSRRRPTARRCAFPPRSSPGRARPWTRRRRCCARSQAVSEQAMRILRSSAPTRASRRSSRPSAASRSTS